MTMLQEVPLNRDEKLPDSQVIRDHLGELATQEWKDFESVPNEGGLMYGKAYEAFLTEKGRIGQRMGIIGTALRGFEAVDSETGEVHILSTGEVIDNLRSNFILDAANEKRYSEAVSLIDSICAYVLENPSVTDAHNLPELLA